MFFYGPLVPEVIQNVLEWSKHLNQSYSSAHLEKRGPIQLSALMILVCCLFGSYYLLARLMEGRLSGGESSIFLDFNISHLNRPQKGHLNAKYLSLIIHQNLLVSLLLIQPDRLSTVAFTSVIRSSSFQHHLRGGLSSTTPYHCRILVVNMPHIDILHQCRLLVPSNHFHSYLVPSFSLDPADSRSILGSCRENQKERPSRDTVGRETGTSTRPVTH